MIDNLRIFLKTHKEENNLKKRNSYINLYTEIARLSLHLKKNVVGGGGGYGDGNGDNNI